jgi:hypothetical protein
VHAEDAMVLPGDYATSGFVFMLGFQRRY